ncbi:YbaN family protein [Geobacter sp. DSM 9736]|uniref:YbaN family protein n=1 Tax=Geobacter sp. DSM 9736 TaxID=1277350 RepID=UPI000B509619|nr:YbaN family protein [Geobacter sp. DSM 9736]
MAEPTNPRQVKSGVLRIVLMVAGWCSVAAGVAGIFLPLVPTVPLLLLAALCFARSSEGLHTWLVEHNRLGPLVRDYLKGAGIPLRAKASALGMIWITVPTSAFLFVPKAWLRVVLLCIAAGVTVYLVRLPTLRHRD